MIMITFGKHLMKEYLFIDLNAPKPTVYVKKLKGDHYNSNNNRYLFMI